MRWDGSKSVWCDKIDADHFYLILYLDESSNAFCQFRRIENKIGSFFEWVIRVVVVFSGIIRCSMRFFLYIDRYYEGRDNEEQLFNKSKNQTIWF